MNWRYLISVLITLGLIHSASAQVIVDEDFDYADQAAFEAAWNPDFGDGRFDLTGFGSTGILLPFTNPDPNDPIVIPPNNDPSGLMGKGVGMTSLISEFNNTSNPGDPDDPAFSIVPSATKSVKFGGDLFDDLSSNKKLTLGLRNDTIEREPTLFGTNFLEIGFYNASTFDPTDSDNAPPNESDPNQLPATDFAYRIQLFTAPDPNAGGQVPVRNPDWQYFPLDPSLDILGGIDPNSPDPNNPIRIPDGRVSSVDIGQGWHRWEATVSETSVTLTLDLFRDGVVNLTRDPNSGDILAGVGAAGFDSEVTWEISMVDNDPNDGFAYDPFTSLRFGVPSGTGGGETHGAIDNVKLELIDAASDNADFDGDGFVTGLDFLIWQSNLGLGGQTDNSNGDANGDGVVGSGDLAVWEGQYGSPPPLFGSIAAVPEPASATLVLLAGCCMGMLARRR